MKKEIVNPMTRNQFIGFLIFIIIISVLGFSYVRFQNERSESIKIQSAINVQESINNEHIEQFEYVEEVVIEEVEEVYIQQTPLNLELELYIIDCCNEYDVSIDLVFGLIEQESNFKIDAKSNTNDYGLMQINEINRKSLEEKFGEIDLMNPYDNVLCGIYILSSHLNNYDNIHRVLMCYNMGSGRTRALFSEGTTSSGYSRSVVENMEKYNN